MTMSGREKAIFSITLMVLLYGVLGLLAKGRLDTWQLKREAYRQASNTLEQERTLLAQRELWQKNYAAVRDLMPVFPADKQVDTYWLRVMDNAATSNKLNILKREPGKEITNAVYEVAIDGKEWEGSLDALVHFLYGLESAGVMLDMRQMFMRVNPVDHSHLKGNFVLYCAYMRERPVVAVQKTENGKRKTEDGSRKQAAVPPASPRKTPSRKIETL